MSFDMLETLPEHSTGATRARKASPDANHPEFRLFRDRLSRRRSTGSSSSQGAAAACNVVAPRVGLSRLRIKRHRSGMNWGH